MKTSKGKGPANGPAKTPKKLQASSSGRLNKQKDPVEVYCRIRPLREDESESCAATINKTVLQLRPPECSLAFRAGHINTTMHTFKTVFGPESTQTAVFDRVGVPLVEDLLAGKNGLLFAYGITNSGKTFTVNGEPEQAGILPRCLDVIFNSIVDVQAAKYVFRSNGTNSYDIISEEEAIVEQKRNRPKKISPRMRAEQPDYGDLLRIPEPRKIDHVVDEDSGYAVFVSYIEIYNNYVYDLLEDSPTNSVKPKQPTSRLLREDSTRNMYVSGAVEVEVKSTEEAFEVLCRGQRKRRVGLTQLNQESSRSHSVFTVRLVQAPLDHSGRDVLQDSSKVHVSQLSLVDLAGSERSSRTQTSGERLKEASSINKALLVLRTCMETLRDNQLNSTNRIVPYRDTKLTHLFKNYFDGEGKVRMVVCVSPREEDYDETIHVMRFAEVTQEVVVDRPQTRRITSGLAPGRKRAYLLYTAALKQAVAEKSLGEETADSSDGGDGVGDRATSGGRSPMVGVPHPYMLALGVLSIQKYLSEECSSVSLGEFKAALEERELVRNKLIEDIKKKQFSFRTNLVATEKDVEELRKTVYDLKHQGKVKDKITTEVKRLNGIIIAQDEKMVQLTAALERATESRLTAEKQSAAMKDTLSRVTQQKQYLMKTTEIYEADKRELEQELTAERVALQRTTKETQSVRSTMQGFVSAEKEKFERLASKMKNKEKVLAIKSEKLRQVEQLIKNSPCTVQVARPRDPLTVVNKGSQSSEETSSGPRTETDTGTGTGTDPVIPMRGKTSRKRSSSENWLEHKPSSNVVSGDLLQPVLKKKKTVTTPKPRHLRSNVRNRYCLEHQEEDSEGDVKTALYKGEIFKTRGGGRSIQFTDVEVLKHNRPTTTKERPRPSTPRTRPRRSQRQTGRGGNLLSQGASLKTAAWATNQTNQSDSSSTSFLSSAESSIDELWTDVETRCAVAVEGRPGGAQPALAHMSPSRPHTEK